MASMDALSESAEMMIKNINELAADEKRVRTSDLDAKTDLKPATVTEMIQRLGDLGLVDYEAYHGVHLTKQGQHVADVIEHRFNILERFLTEILGVEGNEAAEVACRMEHVLTRDVEHKLTTFLGIDPKKESELFCHKINIEEDNEPRYLPLSNFNEGKMGTVKLIFEDNELSKIDQRKDGEVEVIDVKLNNRKTKKIGDSKSRTNKNIDQLFEGITNSVTDTVPC